MNFYHFAIGPTVRAGEALKDKHIRKQYIWIHLLLCVLLFKTTIPAHIWSFNWSS